MFCTLGDWPAPTTTMQARASETEPEKQSHNNFSCPELSVHSLPQHNPKPRHRDGRSTKAKFKTGFAHKYVLGNNLGEQGRETGKHETWG